LAWERLRRIREKAEEYVEKAERPVRDFNEDRRRNARDSAHREYRDTTDRAVREERSGTISHELAERRISRARDRMKRTSEPVGNRVAKKLVGATRDAADIAFAPKYSRHHDRIAAGRKRTYDIVRGTARSYNENVPKSFRKSRQTKQFGNFLLTGSSGSAPRASGWGIMYGPRGRGKGSGGRKGKGKGSSSRDPFWML
jgi:hypothetical protein